MTSQYKNLRVLLDSGGASSTSLISAAGGRFGEILCNSCRLLQNDVSHKQAVASVIPASGSDTSFKSQDFEGLKGRSKGPKTTDLGKHSLKTAVSVGDFFHL